MYNACSIFRSCSHRRKLIEQRFLRFHSPMFGKKLNILQKAIKHAAQMSLMRINQAQKHHIFFNFFGLKKCFFQLPSQARERVAPHFCPNDVTNVWLPDTGNFVLGFVLLFWLRLRFWCLERRHFLSNENYSTFFRQSIHQMVQRLNSLTLNNWKNSKFVTLDWFYCYCKILNRED